MGVSFSHQLFYLTQTWIISKRVFFQSWRSEHTFIWAGDNLNNDECKCTCWRQLKWKAVCSSNLGVATNYAKCHSLFMSCAASSKQSWTEILTVLFIQASIKIWPIILDMNPFLILFKFVSKLPIGLLSWNNWFCNLYKKAFILKILSKSYL